MNTTGSEFPTFKEHSVPSYIIATATIQSVITIFGLLGNSLVIFVLIMARDRQDTSSVTYVLNLAVADFCFLITAPLKIAQDIKTKWIAGEFMCHFAGGFVTYLNFLVSPLFLMVMSIDRFLAVNRAVSSARFRATKSSRVVSMVVWFIACCAVFPIAVIHTSYPDGSRCSPKFSGALQTQEMAATCPQMTEYAECVKKHHKTYAAANIIMLPPSMNLSQDFDDYDFIHDVIDPYPASGHYFGARGRKRRGTKISTGPEPGSNARKRSREKTPSTKRKARRRNGKRQRARQLKAGKVVEISPVWEDATVDLNLIDPLMIATLSPFVALDLIKADVIDPTSSIVQKINAPASNFTTEETGTSKHATFEQLYTTDTQTDSPSTSFVDPCIDIILNSNCSSDEILCVHGDQTPWFRTWVIANFFYSYFIPCGIIVACYVAILRKLYQPSGLVNRAPETRGRIRRQTMRRKVTLMVAMLVISYIVCLTPYFVWQLLKLPGLYVASLKTCFDVERFNAVMVYINSAINPFLYTFLSDQFGTKFNVAWRRLVRTSTERFRSKAWGKTRTHNKCEFTEANNKQTKSRTEDRKAGACVNLGNEIIEMKTKQNRKKSDEKVVEETGSNLLEVKRKMSQERAFVAKASSEEEKQDERSKQANKEFSRHLSSSAVSGSLLSCVCSQDETDCPICIRELQADDDNDDAFVMNDVIDRENRESDSVEVLRFGGDNPNLCKKHRRYYKATKPQKRNSSRMMISGRWTFQSTNRSASKCMTEITSTNM